ncbi:MAG: hypothetical protein M3Y65_05665 [Pseudomonadota bacterium]|nr:hypothetical protein [Pseudomonadota bacterium]
MKRGQVMRLLAGLLTAPFAWVAQMLISEPLVAQVCFPGPAQRSAALPGLAPTLLVLSVACLAAGLGGLLAAWLAWRVSADPADHVSALDRGTRPVGFLALLGMMGSALFCGAIVFTAMALLLVAPCGEVL